MKKNVFVSIVFAFTVLFCSSWAVTAKHIESNHSKRGVGVNKTSMAFSSTKTTGRAPANKKSENLPVRIAKAIF